MELYTYVSSTKKVLALVNLSYTDRPLPAPPPIFSREKILRDKTREKF